MAKRLVIAVDCDDVLVPTAQSVIDDYNQRFGTKLALRHMYDRVSLKEWGTDREDVAIGRVNEFHQSEEYARIKPYSEAVSAIKKLAKNHELHLITGRSHFLEEVTKRMLDTYFTTVEHTNYLALSIHQSLRRSKGEVCQAINANILIDDHIDHGEGALDIVDEVIVFGDYPWNQRETLPEGMVRCADWKATVMEVEAYAAR